MTETKCELCGQPMPADEEMFKFHGYSGPCPAKPPMKMHFDNDWLKEQILSDMADGIDEYGAGPDDIDGLLRTMKAIGDRDDKNPTPGSHVMGVETVLCMSPAIETLTPTNQDWEACETVQDRYDLMKRLIHEAFGNLHQANLVGSEDLHRDLTDDEWDYVKYNVDRKATLDIPLWRLKAAVEYADYLRRRSSLPQSRSCDYDCPRDYTPPTEEIR